MRKITLIMALTTILISCSKEESEQIVLTGRYIHEISICDQIIAEEKMCTESVTFIGNTDANIFFGGGDVGFDVNYKIDGKKIEFIYEGGNKVDLSFTIQNDTTLVRIEDNTTWVRE